MEKSSQQFILERTFCLLLERGYDAVSISDIQSATGMARGLLYHYFGSKEALFEIAVRKYLVMCFDTEILPDRTINDMIKYIIAKYSAIAANKWADFDLPCGVTLADYDFLIYRMIRANGEFKTLFSSLWEKECQAWRIAAQNSITKGEIRDEVDLETIVEFMDCLTYGIWMRSLSDQDDFVKYMEKIFGDYYRLIKR